MQLPVRIVGIKSYLPERILDNEELSLTTAGWDAAKIFEKTGIASRRIAAPDQTSLDMGTLAAMRWFETEEIRPDEVDFLIFCTQSPDYLLPTSACLMHQRLGLSKRAGAYDFNLGCSGYVYGLAQASALIVAGMARNVLLVTADTYSKMINPLDRSVRTLFGDAATATLLRADDTGESQIGSFAFGTDGEGGRDLIVPAGGFRKPRNSTTGIGHVDEFGNARSEDDLYMNGGAVLSFTLREVPILLDRIRALSGFALEDFDYFVLHQANKFMLDTLVRKLGLPKAKVPYKFESFGNTVSSSIPLALSELVREASLRRGSQLALLGFGVGLSWAGAVVKW